MNRYRFTGRWHKMGAPVTTITLQANGKIMN